MRSRSERFLAWQMYSSTAALLSGVVSSPTHSCSGAMTMNVTPKIVGAGGEYFEFARRILYVEEDLGPSERPIQLRWISFRESLQASLSSPSSMRWA